MTWRRALPWLLSGLTLAFLVLGLNVLASQQCTDRNGIWDSWLWTCRPAPPVILQRDLYRV